MKMNSLLTAGCSAIVLAFTASAAQADTTTTVDFATGVRAASNPYLLAGTSTGSGAAFIEARPNIEVKTDQSTFLIDAAARFDEYFRRYNSDFSGRADISYDRSLSEFTHLKLAVGAASSMGGSRDILQAGVGAGTGTVVNPNTDVSAAGLRFRQYEYATDAHLTSNLSALDIVEVGGGVRIFDANSATAQSFRQYGADATYRRQVSELLSIGPKVSYSKVDYRNLAAGDGHILTTVMALKYKLSETASLSANAGASFASIRQAAGASAKVNGFVGELAFCNTLETSTTCLNAGRSIRATSLGGVSTETSISGDQSWRISERDTIRISLGYYRTDQPAASALLFGSNRSRLFSASSSYSRQLSERLFIDVSAQYEKNWGQTIARDANVVGMATIRYRLGQ